jgi:hypothetical protein
VRTLIVVGAKTRRTIGTGVLALVAVAGLGACSEDDGSSEPPLTAAAYQQEVDTACGSIDEALAEIDASNDSDAEWVSRLRTETIPRIRSFIRRINRLGFPPERAQEYTEAYSAALEALAEVDDEDEAYRYLDRSRRGFGPDEDYLTAVREAFIEADVPCD